MFQKLGFRKLGRKKQPYMSETAKDVASGLFGGAAGTLTTFPLDTLTTRAQAKYLTSGKLYHGTTALERLWKGLPLTQSLGPTSLIAKLKNLYKGIPFKLLKTVPGTAVTLGTYGFAKRQFDKHFTSKK